MALVYRGPDNHQGGIVVYKNGQSVGDDTLKSGGVGSGSGPLMIGRLFTRNHNAGYCKCQVDELLIWNRQLERSEIDRIRNIR